MLRNICLSVPYGSKHCTLQYFKIFVDNSTVIDPRNRTHKKDETNIQEKIRFSHDKEANKVKIALNICIICGKIRNK